MKSYKWIPVYRYEMGLGEFIQLGLLAVLSVVLIPVIPISAFLIYTFIKLYRRYSADYIKTKLRSEDVEYFDKDYMSGMLLVKTGKGAMGIYLQEHRDFLFKPQFETITDSSTYLLLKNKDGLYGVYNKELGKMVLPCEYYSVTDNKDGNLLAKKGTQGYIFTHYGTLVKEWSIAEQFGKVMEDMINKME